MGLIEKSDTHETEVDLLFNSSIFAGFVIIVFAVYYLPFLRRFQVEILIAASCLFYAYGQPVLLILLLSAAGTSTAISLAILNGYRARAFATAGVVANLGVLAFFKYNTLIYETLIADLATISGPAEALLYIPLPVGISFYTFQGISLVVDTYRFGDLHERRPPATRSFRDTVFYIIFFPQLVAGPIVKAHDFVPQIGTKYLAQIDWELVLRNLIVGYFFKMVIADNLAQQTFYMAYPYFQALSSIDLVLLLVAYSVQIFADFAGYSMIALGIAALFGYRIPVNFNRPYIATSIADFWRRWHISLSSFLREYLYIPLGGNRKGAARTYINLIVVMGLGGLWHGAAWNYAVWGLWHGVGLALERPFLSSRFYQSHHPGIIAIRMICVFTFATMGWLLFVLHDMSHVALYFESIWTNTDIAPSRLRAMVIILFSLPIFLYHIFPIVRRMGEPYAQPALGVMLAAIILNSGSSDAFIYFQF